MRISSRFKPIWITGAAITIAGCAATLPEPPEVLENPIGVTLPTTSNTTAVTGGDPVSQSPVADAPPEIEIEVLHKANYNPFELDNGKSFRTLQSLEVYRSELGLHSIETPKVVDFSTQQVLASSAGEKPTGGYNISVTKIEDTGDSVVVTVVQSIPGPGCINTEGKTHPFEFVLVPSRKPIQIFERQKVENCR